MSSSNKVAVVTGGSRGIGKAIVIALAEAGYDVAFSYASNKAAASEVENTCSVFGVKVLAVQSNVSEQLEAQALIDEALEKLGRIDVLVNNAGITKDTLLMRMSNEQWEDVINTNLNGVFYTSRAVVKHMVKQKSGRIVNITSVSGVHGNAGQTNYSSSKAGVIGFTKALAKEVGSRSITVNAVAPGFIMTDMTNDLPTEKILEHIPLARLGQAEDIAKTVLFLVTSGDYITGQVIQVDGGLVL